MVNNDHILQECVNKIDFRIQMLPHFVVTQYHNNTEIFLRLMIGGITTKDYCSQKAQTVQDILITLGLLWYSFTVTGALRATVRYVTRDYLQ